MNVSEVDWETYYKEGKASLKKELEGSPKMWDDWTNSDKRYRLITNICVIECDIEKTTGRVTSRYDAHISSDSVEVLTDLWEKVFSKKSYDTTTQHFIADMKNKKIVKFVSVCM